MACANDDLSFVVIGEERGSLCAEVFNFAVHLMCKVPTTPRAFRTFSEMGNYKGLPGKGLRPDRASGRNHEKCCAAWSQRFFCGLGNPKGDIHCAKQAWERAKRCRNITNPPGSIRGRVAGRTRYLALALEQQRWREFLLAANPKEHAVRQATGPSSAANSASAWTALVPGP